MLSLIWRALGCTSPVVDDPSTSANGATGAESPDTDATQELGSPEDTGGATEEIDIINFAPNDSAVRALLLRFGVPEDIINSGSVSGEQLTNLDIDPFLLHQMAEYVAVDMALDGDEAALSTLFITNVGDAAKWDSLSRLDACPNGLSAEIMLANASMRFWEPNRLGTAFTLPFSVGITPERECSYEQILAQGFTPAETAGIFFDSARVGEFWSTAGKAVVPIMDLDALAAGNLRYGSAVLVSPEGHLITAAHIAFDTAAPYGVLRSGLAVYYGGETYPVRAKNVLWYSRSADLVIAQVPELGMVTYLPHVLLAASPPQPGDALMAVGYPPTQTGLDNKHATGTLALEPLFSAGEFLSPSLRFGAHTRLMMNNRVFMGDSGGGVFNAQGELIGINTITSMPSESVNISVAAGLLPEHSTDPRFALLLTDINALYAPTCAQPGPPAREPFYTDDGGECVELPEDATADCPAE